jgi:omega-6 fatty acid desaturase (delta-12 desaturase)
VVVLVWLIGLKAFLFVHLPIMLLAAAIGVWLFYVQHQFEHTTWDEEREWSLHDAALFGSSHYDLPAWLRWFTANIGVHHVHHLCSRIPYYRLPQVLRDHPEFRSVSRVTLLESLGCVRLALWDETQRRLVTFREAEGSDRGPVIEVRRRDLPDCRRNVTFRLTTPFTQGEGGRA